MGGERKRAEEKFEREKAKEFETKNFSPEEAIAKAKALTKPERIYREAMSEETGLFLIYLINMRNVFREKESVADTQFAALKAELRIDTAIPLVGYAIGFPPIDPDPGSEYLRGDYGIDEAGEDKADEYDAETMEAAEDLL